MGVAEKCAHSIYPPASWGWGTGVWHLLIPLSPAGRDHESTFDVPRAARTPTLTPTQAHRYGRIWTKLSALQNCRSLEAAEGSSTGVRLESAGETSGCFTI